MAKREKARLSKYKEDALNGKSFHPGDKVIGYFRDSGGEDQDRSVDEQRTEWHKGCESRRLVAYKEFLDRAKSGTTARGRKGLRDMLNYFESGQAEAESVRGLLLWSFARLARDETDSQFFITNLRRQGFVVQSLTDQIPDNSEFALIAESMAIWRHAAYSRTLSKEVTRGQSHVLANYRSDGGLYELPSGEFVQLAGGGFPPVGYERHLIQTGQNRRGTPRFNSYWKKTEDKDLADRVRKAWEMMLAGASYDEIEQACHLYPSKRAYNSFFTTITYTGLYSFGDFVRENAFEGYVTREEYEQVQEIIDKRAVGIIRRRPAARRYLLSSLLWCGECGSPVHGEKVASGNKKYTTYYYQCASRKTLQEAHSYLYRVRAEYLEGMVFQFLLDEVLNEQKVMGLAASRASAAEKEIRGLETTKRIEELEKVIFQESASIKKLVLQLATTAAELGIVDEVKELISEGKYRRTQAETDLKTLTMSDVRRRLSTFKVNAGLVRQARATIERIKVVQQASGESFGDSRFDEVHQMLKALGLKITLFPGQKVGEENVPEIPVLINSGSITERDQGMMLFECNLALLGVSGANDKTPIEINGNKKAPDLKVSGANDSAPGAELSFPLKLSYPMPGKVKPGPKNKPRTI